MSIIYVMHLRKQRSLRIPSKKSGRLLNDIVFTGQARLALALAHRDAHDVLLSARYHGRRAGDGNFGEYLSAVRDALGAMEHLCDAVVSWMAPTDRVCVAGYADGTVRPERDAEDQMRRFGMAEVDRDAVNRSRETGRATQKSARSMRQWPARGGRRR